MENYIAILLTLTLNSSSCVIQENNVMQSQISQAEPIETIARNLTDAGYSGLFLSGDRSLSNSIWQNGENRLYLEQIVQSNHYSDLARILASEVLYEKVPNYPPQEWYENRPSVCKKYSCANDKRIWKDFEKMEIDREWIDENLKRKEFG